MAAVAVVATAAVTAHAASAPLTARSLLALKSSADAMPNLLVSDAFTGATGASIGGRISDTGQPWFVARGVLQIDTNRVRCTSCSNGDYAAAVIDADLASVTATVDVRSTSGSGYGGLVLNSDSMGTQAFVAWYRAGSVQLLRFAGGVSTLVAGATVATPPNNTDIPLSVKLSAGTYVLTFNGSPALSYTLSAADQATFGANTYFGVIVYDDPNLVRLDYLRVTR